jgi:hypothetical protein
LRKNPPAAALRTIRASKNTIPFAVMIGSDSAGRALAVAGTFASTPFPPAVKNTEAIRKEVWLYCTGFYGMGCKSTDFNGGLSKNCTFSISKAG